MVGYRSNAVMRIGGALAVIAFSGCATAKHVATPEASIERFIYEGWTLGWTTAELRERLGPPVSLTIEPVENRHVEGQIDEIRTVSYDGLVLMFYKVSEAPERELLMSISLTSSYYEVGWGLKVGVEKERVRAVLGEKFQTLRCPGLQARMPYALTECEAIGCAWAYTHDVNNSEVLFTFKAGHVNRIDWSFYVD